MKKLKNYLKLAVALLVLALPVVSVGKAFAASTGTVSATITPQNISVSVSDGSVAYGTLGLSSSEDTTTAGVNDSQTATNDGNVTEDFNIRSTDATGGSAWTLGATPGADQYAHSYCTSNCDASPTWNNMTTSYSSLATGVSTSGNQLFDLQIETPTSSSDFVQKSITVTIQAVQN